MSNSEKPKPGPPESPTTARELDFDDDDVSASPKPSKPADSPKIIASNPPPSTEAPPPQPPRPMSPRDEAEMTLCEAFPTIDKSVIRAVLVASGGQVEPAFNGLLAMSDPDAQDEPAPPAQPPRPPQPAQDHASKTQIESDELYARQLAEHYNNQANTYPRRDSSRDYRGQDPRIPRQQRETGLKANELYDDRDRSFIDDDLPVIRDNIRKGFLETQSKVNSFITNLRKKIDGEDEEEEPPPPPPRRPDQGYYGARRSGEAGRRSGDRHRYDADPEVLSDDFALSLQDEPPPPQPVRPAANPDLFKQTSQVPPSEKRVSFQDSRSERYEDTSRSSPDPTKNTSTSGARSKWQPLNTIDPSPVADHDPFSLGDSDEDDSRRKTIKMEDTESVKKTTAEAVGDSIGKPDSTAKQDEVGKH